jgi:hypothetical protein
MVLYSMVVGIPKWPTKSIYQTSLFEILAASAEKCIFCLRIILDGGLIVIKDVGQRDSFQVGAKPAEKAPDFIRAHLRSAPLDV